MTGHAEQKLPPHISRGAAISPYTETSLEQYWCSRLNRVSTRTGRSMGFTPNPISGPYKIRPNSTLISMNGGGVLAHLLRSKWTVTSAAANGEEGNGPVNGQWHEVPGQGEMPVYTLTPVHVTLWSPIETAKGPVFAIMT